MKVLGLILFCIAMTWAITLIITGLYLVAHPGIPEDREKKDKKKQ